MKRWGESVSTFSQGTNQIFTPVKEVGMWRASTSNSFQEVLLAPHREPHRPQLSRNQSNYDVPLQKPKAYCNTKIRPWLWKNAMFQSKLKKEVSNTSWTMTLENNLENLDTSLLLRIHDLTQSILRTSRILSCCLTAGLLKYWRRDSMNASGL